MRDVYFRISYSLSRPGSAKWLVAAEVKYGGIQKNVPRNKVSSHDPRTKEEISRGGMIGGDRMMHHGYADQYSRYLTPFLDREDPITFVEIGILRGTGLAIWCDLFSDSRIIGLDIDLGHIRRNWDSLVKCGAFRKTIPELHEFDQFADNERLLQNILTGSTIDICVDDGFHSNESILTTMRSVIPHLAEEFVYFVEDNDRVHSEIKKMYPGFEVDSVGELTVVSRGMA